MNEFQILEPTPAILKSKTPRDERHGDDKVPAISLGWKMRVPNTWLDRLSEGLCAVFYEYADPVQRELDGVPVVTLTKLRTTAIGSLTLPRVYEGCTVAISISDKSMTFGACKVDKFTVEEMMEGGTVEIHFRMGTSDIDARTAGKLVMMTEGSEHMITLSVPEQDEDTPKQSTIDKMIDAGDMAVMTPVMDAEFAEVGETPIEALAKAEVAAAVKNAKRGDVVTVKVTTTPKAEADGLLDAMRNGGEVPTDKPKRAPRTIAQKIARAEREAAKRAQS